MATGSFRVIAGRLQSANVCLTLTCSELVPGKGYPISGYWVDSIRIRPCNPSVGKPMLRHAKAVDMRSTGRLEKVRSRSVSQPGVAIHKRISCDMMDLHECGMNPIVGKRFKKRGKNYAKNFKP